MRKDSPQESKPGLSKEIVAVFKGKCADVHKLLCDTSKVKWSDERIEG